MIAKVLQRKFLSDDIYSLNLELEKPLNSKPGQFILLSFGNFSNKAYSIVKEDGKLITLGIKIQNGFSKLFSEIDIGVSVDLIGPFGSFIPRIADKVVLIGGGIGITPLISLYAYYKNSGVSIKVLLSSNNDFVFLDCFDDPLLFDTSKGNRISSNDIDDDSLVYICGPPKMIDDLRTSLISLNFSQENILSEEFTGERL